MRIDVRLEGVQVVVSNETTTLFRGSFDEAERFTSSLLALGHDHLAGRVQAVMAFSPQPTLQGSSESSNRSDCSQRKAFLMTTDEAKRPKNCATCGKGPYRRTARAGRTENYKGFDIELPADYPLMECDACGEILMSPADMKYLAPIIEERMAAKLPWLTILSSSSQALFFKEVAEARAGGESVDVLIQQWRNTASAVAEGHDLSSPLHPDDWSHSFEPVGISSAAEAAAVQALIDNPPPATERLKAAMKPGPASTRRLPSTTPTSFTDEEPG